jgi:hypothetical protein
MRRLVLGTLLVITPFSGMRVICIDSPTDMSGSSANIQNITDCERLCPLHPPPDAPSSPTPSGTQNDSDCALSTDTISLSIVASTAVLRPQEPQQVPLVVSAVSADAPWFYQEPALSHLGPPPKPQAL